MVFLLSYQLEMHVKSFESPRFVAMIFLFHSLKMKDWTGGTFRSSTGWMDFYSWSGEVLSQYGFLIGIGLLSLVSVLLSGWYASRFAGDRESPVLARFVYLLYYLDALFVAGVLVFIDSPYGDEGIWDRILDSLKLGTMGALIFFPFALFPLVLVIRTMRRIVDRRGEERSGSFR